LISKINYIISTQSEGNHMKRISLAGEWQASWTEGQHGQTGHAFEALQDTGRYLTLSFPGTVHAGLEQAGLIADPRVGIHSLQARWVEEQYWILRRKFFLEKDVAAEPVFLHIDVLDGVAEVAVNGKVVGSQANANRPADFELSGCLVEGENELVILLESGLFYVADLPARQYSQSLETILNKRHQLRRSQYQFGWDWNPRLATIGLHGAIELVCGAGLWLKQVSVLAEVAEDLRTARIRIRPLYQWYGQRAQRAVLHASTVDGIDGAVELLLEPGQAEADVALDVTNPHLWWPRGHGEAFLYPLELWVEVDGQAIARWNGRTGLRRVQIDQPVHPEGGHYFHLKINNRTIFCKGANWVPPEMCGHAVDPRRVEQLVALAEAENMNTLRLWGGGVWANHTLLNLCDERGFLLWHDLLFACSKYPADRPDFLAEVEREVAWGIREFSPHPSLAVWCGNNELEWGLWGWHYKEFGSTAPDMVLFHHTIPILMAQLDPTRPYWPSSPYSSPSIFPNEPTTGDQHPWNVSLGTDDVNFWAYREYVDRFPNEGGVLGCAPLASLRKFLPGEQLKMRSFAWEHHDNTILFTHARPGFAYRTLEHWLGRRCAELDLEHFTLASGLLQAEGLKEYIANFRRRWPSTSSAIYWMFNDSWPTVNGWGTFDYYLKRKLSFHPVRRAFAPIGVFLADEGERIGVYIVNDSDQPLVFQLVTGSFVPNGPTKSEALREVSVEAYSSSLAQYLPRDPQRIAYAVLHDAQGLVLAQDRLLLRQFKEWDVVAHPQISVEIVQAANRRWARYSCADWAWGVVLDPSGEAEVQDDVFDLLPGIAYDVPLADGESPRAVEFCGNALIR
jgi:beta-mannosidase